MAKEISLAEYKKAYREMIKENERRGFLIHAAVYVLVNIMLIVINLVYSPSVVWFFYPLIGWGIGLAMHYMGAIKWIESDLEKKEAEAEYRARMKK